MAASAVDPSTMVLNPAAIAFGRGWEATFGLAAIQSGARFKDAAAATILGTPIGGNNGGDSGTTVPLPSLYLTADFGGGFRFGLATTSLYGLGTYYREGWIGRYHALNSQLLSAVVQPTLSWRPASWLSLGAGLLVQYTQARSTAALDLGTVDAALFGGAFGGVPGGSDGTLRVKADGFAAGFTLGAIFEPLSGTRVGVAYRSAMTHNLSGPASFEPGGATGQAIAAATGAFRDTAASVRLKLPDSAVVGVQQRLGGGLTLLADLHWTHWSRIRELRVAFDNPAQPDALTPLPWRNSVFAAVGLRWDVHEVVALRAGYAHDQSPVRSRGRTPAIPDADSHWVAFGLQYRPLPSFVVDVAAGRIITRDAPVAQRAGDPGNAFRGDLFGTVRGAGVTFVALQATYRF